MTECIVNSLKFAQTMMFTPPKLADTYTTSLVRSDTMNLTLFHPWFVRVFMIAFF